VNETLAVGTERPEEEPWRRPTATPEEQGVTEAGPETAAAAGITANPEATPERPTTYVPPPAIRLDGESPGTTTWAPPGLIELPVSPAATMRPVDLSTSAATRERRRRPQLRTSATILLFLAGLAVGAVGLRLAASAPAAAPADGFPSLSRTTAEPIQAGAVARELAVNDVQGLAQLLDGDTLTALQSQLKPLVSFESVTFVGATTFDRDTLAGYVVRGRDQDGALGLVGLVIRLRDGQVVAQ
jgi:hypothetical protein